METYELHDNFILLHEFQFDEPLKKWVRDQESYVGGYHDDWNTLMPLVEKIEEMEGVTITIKGSRCRITVGKKVFSCHTIIKLNSTYRAVVEFVKWHKQHGA